MNRIPDLAAGGADLSAPVCLFEGGHSVYWVGSEEPSPFRCNAYLVVDGDHRVLIDPGSTQHHFPQVKRRVEQIVPPSSITHIVVHHQDPDLCDSLPAWIETAPDLTIVTGDFHLSTQMIGADTSDFFPALDDVEHGRRFIEAWSATARRLHDEFEVSVAFLQGKRALGGMLELLVHCHYLVSHDGGSFGFPEVGLPVVPDV